MNTATSPSVATPVASASSDTAPLASEQEVLTLRAQLQAAEQKLASDRLAADIAAREALHAKIGSIPGMLGVTNLKEVIALIQRESGLAARPPASKGKAAKRPFPTALSDDTKAQMRSMLEASATSRAVAEALGVGVSTVDSWKAKWKLTHRGLGGHPTTRRAAPKAKRSKRTTGGSGTHFTPAKRARIIAALRKPNPSVAAIARREHASRQGIYDLRAKLLHAA